MAPSLIPLALSDVSPGNLVLYNEIPSFGGGIRSGFIVRQLIADELNRFAIGESAWQTVFPESNPRYGVATLSNILVLAKSFWAADNADLNTEAIQPGPDPYGA